MGMRWWNQEKLTWWRFTIKYRCKILKQKGIHYIHTGLFRNGDSTNVTSNIGYPPFTPSPDHLPCHALFTLEFGENRTNIFGMFVAYPPMWYTKKNRCDQTCWAIPTLTTKQVWFYQQVWLQKSDNRTQTSKTLKSPRHVAARLWKKWPVEWPMPKGILLLLAVSVWKWHQDFW